MRYFAAFAFLSTIFCAITADADETAATPILSVADYDGDGWVTGHDLILIRRAIRGGEYIAFYDKDANGVLDHRDRQLSALDYGKRSTVVDREMARLYVKFGWLQNKTAADAAALYGFRPIVASLAGHGEHWMNDAGAAAVGIGGKATFDMIQGMNVPKDGGAIPGIFWGEGAIPLFDDPSAPTGLSSLDWPFGDNWKSERVQAFAGEAPHFTSSEAEMWHTHAGLCLVYESTGQGYIHQYTSFDECQAYPNAAQIVIGEDPVTGAPIMGNIWANLWMIHLWFFDLNPNGIFAGTHPDVDPDSPSEADTTDGREIPPFFMQHHHP
jgi:hypothetical protein